MPFLSFFYYSFIVMAVAIFMWIFDDPFGKHLFEFIQCIIIAIPIVIVINYFKISKTKNKNECKNKTSEEKKKDEIRE